MNSFCSEIMNKLIFNNILINFLNVIYLTNQIPCGEPGVPHNGYRIISRNKILQQNISTNTYSPGTTAEYYCNSDPIMIGSQKRQCYQSGQWYGAVPQCPNKLDVKSFVNYTQSYQDSERINTDKAIDGNTKTCFTSISADHYHSWELHLKNIIKIKTIKVIFSGENFINNSYTVSAGIVNERNFNLPHSNYSNSLNYIYNMITPIRINYIEIIVFSSASHRFQLCELEIFGVRSEMSCGTPDVPSNGLLSTEFRSNQLFANFNCNPNYELNGSKEIKCNSDGLWSAVSPVCKGSQIKNKTRKSTIKSSSTETTTSSKPITKPMSCERLTANNGVFSFTDNFNIRSLAILQCNKGYQLSAEYHSSECLSSGQWSHFGNYSLNCDQIQCSIIAEIQNAKLVQRLINGKAIYLTELEIRCVDSVIVNRFCGQNSQWVSKEDVENPKAMSDLNNLCKTISNINSNKNDEKISKSVDTSSLILVSVIAAIITCILLFIAMTFIKLLKRKLLSSQSTNERQNTCAMPSVKEFSYIQIKHNFANKRMSELSHIYQKPIYETKDDLETCFSSSVAFRPGCQTSIIHTYSEPFDGERSGNNSNSIEESVDENIYSEPYVSAENEIYSSKYSF